MSYTLGQAAKATGKSKTTIQRAIAKGRISAGKNDVGAYSIDPAELHRVFPIATVAQPSQSDGAQPQGDGEGLRAKVTMLESMLSREREISDDLRDDRDRWRQQATALLTDQRKGWWTRIFLGR